MVSCSQNKSAYPRPTLKCICRICKALILILCWLLSSSQVNTSAEETKAEKINPAQLCPEGKETQSQQSAQPSLPSQNANTTTSASPSPSTSSHQTTKPTKVKAREKGHTKKRLRGTPPCLAWIDPTNTPKAVLLCVHGLGLYNGTYEPFGKLMAANGIATYAIDMRGFGSWMEAKGREKVDFAACFEDVKAVLRVIHRAHPGLPVFLLGESMGGAISLQATALYPELIDGLISSVPAGDRFQQKRTALKVALRLLAYPDKPFNVGAGVIKQATQKSELREAWQNDPLARLNLSPRELLQFQEFMNHNHDRAREIKSTPVLIVQGAGDKLVRPEGTVELYNELSTPDRQLVLVPNAEHLIFEENQFNQETFALVLKWIEDRLQKPSPSKTESSLNKLPEVL